MSNQPNHDIMKQDVIDREELIQYLTWILEHDGELQKFYYRQKLKTNEDDLVPDVEAFRDWLREQEFDNIIRESYFEEYIKELYHDIGEYDPKSFLHAYLNWGDICVDLLDCGDYYRVFDDGEYHQYEYHPYNIFGEEFVCHI